MNATQLPPQDFERLVSVCGLQPLNTDHGPIFELAARQAASLCGTPVGLVTILREHEEAFLGRTEEFYSDLEPRPDAAFCLESILSAEATIVEDTLRDPHLADHPAVKGEPFVRFYAGVPIFDRSGLPLGAVCVADVVPRTLSSQRLLVLQRLAAMVSVVLEARRALGEILSAREMEREAAAHRMDESLEALFGSANGFRPRGH